MQFIVVQLELFVFFKPILFRSFVIFPTADFLFFHQFLKYSSVVVLYFMRRTHLFYKNSSIL